MAFIPGFEFRERLYESKVTLVLRAMREEDGLPVIIKLLKNDYPSAAELSHYRREFAITQSLDLPGVIRSYDLRRHDRTLLIVFEDFGAMSVRDLLRHRPLALDEFYETAIQVTTALCRVHEAQIIHKDLNPRNVVINPGTGEVKIIDFGISTRSTTERPVIRGPQVLEGTLAYMSPEQTGRMNRLLDYRTDFYSLGATLYEMLTRSLPFEAEDDMELVHCHIAAEPVPVHRRNQEVSLALSKVVSKLMAKKAEDRYQSAAGIMADLETLRAGGSVERFEPGRMDVSDRFHIPERLYGRNDEVELLLEGYERTRRGRAEMMLVTGHSGAGKTALIREIHKPITRSRGHFISGKFDQLQHNVPYSGLVAAFKDLVRQLLTETKPKLAQWRMELEAALAPNGRVILDVLPDLELIIGPQPPAASLGADEAANRFNRTMGQLLRAVCARDNMVVLFLDDLQWADGATLNLLRMLLTDGGISRLFLIGAYRDNEVSAGHPLSLVLRDIEESGGKIRSIAVAQLGLADVAKLVGDTLRADPGEVTALARLVVQKTQGNPLFVRQFLMNLHREGLIRRVPATRTERARWTWDLQAIRSANLTDNVVELLLGKLRRLPADTQESLRLAACIGNRFDIDTLSVVRRSSSEQTFESLRPAIDEELIWPLSELAPNDADDVLSPLIVREFGFQHDRIQQAAYCLIEEDQRRSVHLAIGRRLHATLPPESRAERIFELADHLNLGRALMQGLAERRDLAQLNLLAARRAADATAYASALSYVQIAQELLGEEGWETGYDLTIEAYRQRASLEYLNRNFDASSAVVATTLRHARTDLEKAEVYFTQIAQLTQLAQFQDALAAGRNALRLLGVDLPPDEADQAGQQSLAHVEQLLRGRSAASLADNPDLRSREMALAQRCLRHLTITAFLSNQQLFPVVVGTSVALSLEHGNAPESALSFANYGLLLGAAMGRYQEGLEFGQLGLRLCERYGVAAPTATVCLVLGSELIPWVQHVRHAIAVINRGYQHGVDSGDILWAGYLLLYRTLLDAFSGKRISETLEGIDAQLEFTSRTQNHGAEAGIRAHQIVLSTLAGRTKSSSDFAGPEVDETAFLRSCEERGLRMGCCVYHILKAQALYLFGRPQQALDATREADGLLNYIVNHPNLADHLLYQSLSLAALWDGLRREQQDAAQAQLQANLARLAAWADSCPDNFLAKRLMVEAEMARIAGDDAAADLYDNAIEAAHRAQFVHDEALANELAARFVMERRPKSRTGTMYLRDAQYAYRLWGAQRKAEELEVEFPLLQSEAREDPATQDSSFTLGPRHASTTGAGGLILDLNTLIKAGQTISGEVSLGRLLDRLLGILIQNAGAQRGVLLLSRDGELYIEAEGSIGSAEMSVLMSIPLDSADGAALVPLGIAHFAARTKEVVVVDDAQQDERFMMDPYVQKRETRSVLCQPILNQRELIGLIYLENDLVSAVFTPDRARLLALLSGQIAVSIKNAELVAHLEEKVRERTVELELRTQFIEQTFGRYMSSEIADSLLKSPEGLDFGGQKTTVTVMMSDLRGFTAFSETLPPETIVKLINNYFSRMTDIIQKYNGTIDQFIGDAILTIFGAPLQRPNDAERAVACALEMQIAMAEVNRWNAEHGFPKLEMGIGINTGEVVAGNIGSNKRAKYSIIGSNVNLASRIESFTVGGQILISGATRDAVKAPLVTRGSITLEPKGVRRPLTIYDVAGLGGGYGLALQMREVQWTNLDPAVGLTFQLVTEKGVAREAQPGALVRFASDDAEIRSRAAPPAFTDLKLTLEPGGTNMGSIYAKVIDRTADECFIVRFTAVPADMREHLNILARLQPTLDSGVR